MLSLDITETIAAIASAPGAAARGIIRISGPGTIACLRSSFIVDGSSNEAASFWNSDRVTSSSGRLRIDENVLLPGRLLLWPNKRSYTHQPTAEFHTFGSPPLLQLGLEHVCQRGARLAEPGEFTLRAFLSGRIDLPQAEAVLAVIDSNNEEQVQTALRQLAGGLTGPLSEIRNQLISIVAELEAGLDFVEEDIEFISKQELLEGLLSISANLQTIVKQISSNSCFEMNSISSSSLMVLQTKLLRFGILIALPHRLAG